MNSHNNSSDMPLQQEPQNFPLVKYSPVNAATRRARTMLSGRFRKYLDISRSTGNLLLAGAAIALAYIALMFPGLVGGDIASLVLVIITGLAAFWQLTLACIKTLIVGPIGFSIGLMVSAMFESGWLSSSFDIETLYLGMGACLLGFAISCFLWDSEPQ